MTRKILYFINPASGPKRKISPSEIITAATSSKKIDFQIQETNASGNYPGLSQKIIDEHFTDVVICGGDGSVSQVVASLRDVDVNIGIIPSGSGNGLARAAGISLNIEKALQLIFDGKSVLTDAFLINDSFSCMLSGIGFDAQVAHDFATAPSRGLTTYIQKTVTNFFRATPYTFDLCIDSRRFTTSAFFISIANADQFGNNVRIAPKASLHDGLIDLVIVKKMNKTMLLWEVAKHLLTGQLSDLKESFHNMNIVYLQLSHFEIVNHTMAPLHIDGDPSVTASHFRIKVLPNAFKLIRPTFQIRS